MNNMKCDVKIVLNYFFEVDVKVFSRRKTNKKPMSLLMSYFNNMQEGSCKESLSKKDQP